MKTDNRLLFIIGFIILSIIPGCTSNNLQPEPTISLPTETGAIETMVKTPEIDEVFAHVLSVDVSGEANAYQFRVEISSPDLGCEQYADWWEVFDDQGNLLYRRILAHSHVNEQPFVRSGGPVAIEDDTIVWVRAHMHPYGYGGEVLKGSVSSGFQPAELPPLPENCAF